VFSTVQQVAGGSRRLPWGSAELSLTFDQTGIEISGERRGEHSHLPWASVTRVSRGATEAMPEGGSVTVIGIESPGRIMRFAVASDRRDPIQLTALSEQVRRWTAAATPVAPLPGLVPPPRRPDGEPEPSGLEPSHPAPAQRDPDAGSEPSGGAEPSEPGPPEKSPERSALVVATLAPNAAPAVEPGLPVLPEPPATWTSSDPPPPERKRRTRRIPVLLVALVLLASGAGLAIALSGSGGSPMTAGRPPTSVSQPDQVLANQLMLNRGDLPTGWTVNSGGSGTGNSPRIQTGESKITRAFAGCMGISQTEAALVLGGSASDQTAQASSPVFVGPPAPDQPGFALELQTAASIVRSHQDEQVDLAPLADARYPQCFGAALASETQLGADSASGRNEKPSPSSVTPVNLIAPAGEQVSGLLVSFSVSDRSVSVPVEVETVSVGHDRTEANIQALAIGGQIPSAALSAPIATFEQRVAAGGSSAEA
jgi:hypothetical protein